MNVASERVGVLSCLQVLLLGDSSVGKSSLLLRFVVGFFSALPDVLLAVAFAVSRRRPVPASCHFLRGSAFYCAGVPNITHSADVLRRMIPSQTATCAPLGSTS